MHKKMKRFNEGDVVELESKTGRNENIGDDVRERAMAAMAAKEADGEEKKEAPKKAAPKKKEATYSPKSQPESDREENSAFMKQFRKDEAAAKKSSFAGKTSAFAGKTSAFKKMAAGGSASSRADGCAIKGKTKGRMV
jgi:hypothetical protein